MLINQKNYITNAVFFTFLLKNMAFFLPEQIYLRNFAEIKDFLLTKSKWDNTLIHQTTFLKVRFLAMAEIKQACLCSFGLSKTF